MKASLVDLPVLCSSAAGLGALRRGDDHRFGEAFPLALAGVSPWSNAQLAPSGHDFVWAQVTYGFGLGVGEGLRPLYFWYVFSSSSVGAL